MVETIIRLWHKKNKGVQQSHASSRNSEAIAMWKVACHPLNRHVVVCDDYSFKNTRVFILLQWDVWTIIKLKLKQTSKEYQKEFHHNKNMRKASQNVFSVHITILQNLWWFKASLEQFSRKKYCFQWSNLYWIKSIRLHTKLNIVLFFVAFLN